MASSGDLGDDFSEYSRRLVPTVIDETARSEPGKIYAAIPVSPGILDAGFRDITFAEFASAINGAAWWLEKELGKSSDFKTLAYLGPNDIRYPIVAIAAVKVGYKMLFTSPRNSVQGHINLFNILDCNTMVTTKPQPAPVTALLAKFPIKTVYIPGVAELLEREHPSYPYTKTYEEARDDPFVSLHTSGSTGLPKPMTLTHGFFAAYESVNRASPPPGQVSLNKNFQNTRAFNAMPPFHGAGVTLTIGHGVFMGMISVFPPPGGPINADMAIQALKHAHADIAFIPPSTIEDISKKPLLLNQLSSLRQVWFAGGALPKPAGDLVNTKTRVANIMGATEFGCLPQFQIKKDDWEGIAVNPIAGAEFRHHSGDLYELIIVRHKDWERYQPTFHMFPSLEEYSMKDLYVKHPNAPGLWIPRGRSDDIIVFLNGEKMNPITMEDALTKNLEVRSALVGGNGRLQSALLIEPVQNVAMSVDERARFIEKIWPTIAEANLGFPAHGKVSKSHILFTTPEKPMLRAGKGTVQRRNTLEAFEKELDKLYADADITNDIDVSLKVNIQDSKSLQEFIDQVIKQVTSFETLHIDDDFFLHGMDSLQVLRVVRNLKAGLNGAGLKVDTLAPSTIYTNPTVSKLAVAMMALKDHAQATKHADREARIEQMKAMLEKYSSSLPSSKGVSQSPNGNYSTPQVVVLTGSTGALGSYLLEALYASPKISKIYCLNRSPNSSSRQATVNASRGLSTTFDMDRVHFLTSDLSTPHLGVPSDIYTTILTTATLVLHNAWTVDFNLSLSSFEPHIRGVRNLIDLSTDSPHTPHIFFLSSIGTVMNYSLHHTGPVPEAIIPDFALPQAMGYSEAKHVSERLLSLASTTSGIPISVCRVGQIAGPVSDKGMWNKSEWVPSLIASSAYLGLLPESIGTITEIDWLPIDHLAPIIVTLALSAPRVHHTVNPNTTPWSSLLPTIRAALPSKCDVVPYDAWLKALKRSSREVADPDRNPAVRSLEFFEDLATVEVPALEITCTADVSRLADVGGVGPTWMEMWMRQWGYGKASP